MARLFDKFIGIMGFGDDDNEEYDTNEYEEGYSRRGESFRNNREDVVREPLAKDNFSREMAIREGSSKRKPASVVSIHTQKQVRVIVVEPISFEEAQGIAEHLKARKSVILNLEKTNEHVCQRIVDFISGTTYALGGNMQKVGNGIFLFVPNNVDISGELNFKTSERDILWPKINN